MMNSKYADITYPYSQDKCIAISTLKVVIQIFILFLLRFADIKLIAAEIVEVLIDKMKNFNAYYFILFLILNSCQLFAQDRSISEIDSLLELNQEYSWIDRIKALKYAKKASVLAEKMNNSEKKAYSYVYMAKTLNYLGLSKESLSYLDKVKKEQYFTNDKTLQALVKEETSVNYSKLGLFTEVFNENSSILQLLRNENTPLAARVKLRAYGNIAANYMNMCDYRRAFAAIKVAEDYSNEPLLLKNKNIKSAFANLSVNKGYIYLNYFKNKDSALHYFNKAVPTISNDKGAFKAYVYRALGDYYFAQKQYEQSLTNYLKSLEDLDLRKIEIVDLRGSLYEHIAELYGLLGKKDKQDYFLYKYNKENEKVTKYYPVLLRKTVNVILQDNKANSSKEKDATKVILIISLVVTIIFSGVIYLIRSRRSKKLLLQKDERLLEKKQLISKFEAETESLKKNVNFTTEELVEMANTNDSNFYNKFNETFPEFEKILLGIAPSLKKSDFIILAYIILNFDTKKIADVTFKSVRTIQNKKYTIRKKLGISSTEDIYIWLKMTLS